eukprot:537400-Amphidinium_carterae.1
MTTRDTQDLNPTDHSTSSNGIEKFCWQGYTCSRRQEPAAVAPAPNSDLLDSIRKAQSQVRAYR